MLDLIKLAVLDVGPLVAIVPFALGVARLALWAASHAPQVHPEPERRSVLSGLPHALSRSVLMKGIYALDKLLWSAAIAFHLSLTLALIGHLRGFGLEALNEAIAALGPASSFVKDDLPLALGFVFVIAAVVLLARRAAVKEVRLASGVSDYAVGLLVLAIGLTGTLMRLAHTPEPFSTSLAFGLLTLSLEHSPPPLLLYLHVLSAEVLVALLPFSKLAHAVTALITSSAHGAALPGGDRG